MEWIKPIALVGFGISIMLIWQHFALKEFMKQFESTDDDNN